MAMAPTALGSDDKTRPMNSGQGRKTKMTDLENLAHGIIAEKLPNPENTRVI